MTRQERSTGADTHTAGVPGISKMRNYSFRQFTLSVSRRTLFNGKDAVRLNAKTFDLLLLLVQRAGEVITKDEVMAEVWNESFVEEGNIAVHVRKLRRALGETSDLKFIHTASGNGYSFVAPVRELDESESPEEEIGLRFNSIAVLPLINDTGDEELDYLVEGLTDGFINSLSRIPGLRVINRHAAFRYKDHTDRLKEIGTDLGVEVLVTGRLKVVRTTLMISLDLTNAKTLEHIWGSQFLRPAVDFLELQSDILSQISHTITNEIHSAALTNNNEFPTHDWEAHKLLLKGNYFLEQRSKESIEKALKYFNASTAKDPMNVAAYVQTVESFLSLYFLDYISHQEATSRITPILVILGNLNQSHDLAQAMLGALSMYVHWDFAKAEKHFENAIRINGNCLIARHRLANLHLATGRFEKALKELQRSMLIDPLSVLTLINFGKVLYKMGHYDNAEIHLQEALELAPGNYVALNILGAVLLEKGELEHAIETFEHALALQFNLETLAMIGYVEAKRGNNDAAIQVADQIAEAEGNELKSLKLAKIYTAMGMNEHALKLIFQAIEERDVDLVSLNADPRWSNISGETEFLAALELIGLNSR